MEPTVDVQVQSPWALFMAPAVIPLDSSYGRQPLDSSIAAPRHAIPDRSDDAEWRVIAPHLPKPCATGQPREWPMREIVNGIFYMMRAVTSSSPARTARSASSS